MIFGSSSSSKKNSRTSPSTLLPLALLVASATARPAFPAPGSAKNVALAAARRSIPEPRIAAVVPKVARSPAASHARRAEQRKRSASKKEVAARGFPNNAAILASVEAAAEAAQARADAHQNAKRALDFTVDVDALMAKRDGGDTLLRKRTAACLDSTATDVTINSALFYGGAGTVVSLCPGATINLSNPIVYTAASQEVSTQGYPTDNTRATLIVTGANQANAITTTCGDCDFSSIRNIQVNGQRPELGYMSTGAALIEVGGSNNGQVVDQVHTFEPRGWSALHIIEGNLDCTNTTISNNQVGPSGNAPSGQSQFRKRDATIAPGQWADGISLSCTNSYVHDNVITDATDGAIVVFGAPGSHIHHNTIISNTRHTMGGLNAVDYNPFGGDYTGTIIEQNTVIANTSFIKVGMGLGGMVWGSDNQTAVRNSGGLFQNNVFKSGSTGYFGYAIAVAGHEDATVLDNDATGANFGGTPSAACIPNPMVPTSQAFVFDQWTTPGSTLQSNFVNDELVFLICQGPGNIVGKGEASALTDDLLTVSSDSRSVATTADEEDMDQEDKLESDEASSSSAVLATATAASSTAATSSVSYVGYSSSARAATATGLLVAGGAQAGTDGSDSANENAVIADIVNAAAALAATREKRNIHEKRSNPFEIIEASKAARMARK